MKERFLHLPFQVFMPYIKWINWHSLPGLIQLQVAVAEPMIQGYPHLNMISLI